MITTKMPAIDAAIIAMRFAETGGFNVMLTLELTGANPRWWVSVRLDEQLESHK